MANTENYEKKVYTHPLATLSANSKGRVHNKEADPFRSEFQRDSHRILYSQPFRRLRHKTQVFFLANNDHVCTRLEHSLYVASASRTIARNLELNEDLAEAIGLGHDLGHAPFGHHGEKVLNEISKKADLNIVFNHEVNGLRVVDKLGALDREKYFGLNLTYEVRDGIISHNGEEFKKDREIIPYTGNKVLDEIKVSKEANNPTTLEGCIVRMVDKIAYAGRDLEDGIKAGIIDENNIPKAVTSTLGNNNGKIVGALLQDLIVESNKSNTSICLSLDKHAALVELIDFNYDNIYKSEDVKRYKTHASVALKTLFNQLLDDLNKTERLSNRENLPKTDVYDTLMQFIIGIDYNEDDKNEIIVFDFISGMTDNYVNYCIDEIFKPKAII